MITTTYHSPLGDLMLAADARGLRGVWFSEDERGPVDISGLELDMRTGVLTGTDGAPVEQIEGADAESGGNPLHAAHPANAGAVSVLERAWAWLNAYFAGQAPLWIPPLALDGDEATHAVWVEALALHYGETCSFVEFAGRVATHLGMPAAHGTAAVAAALADNPIAIIVPTHRVAVREAVDRASGYAVQLRALERQVVIR